MSEYVRVIARSSVVLQQCDITRVRADAIVNAANAALAGGGGVDGAIHRAGGPAIAAACRELPLVAPGIKCPTGEVRVTAAGELDARWVLHAVGPVYDSSDPVGSGELLARTYSAALTEAARLGAASIAFPSISTGAYRFPLRPAARIAAGTVAEWLKDSSCSLRSVIFALFAEKDLAVFQEQLEAILED